jgi:hypothetical protein
MIWEPDSCPGFARNAGCMIIVSGNAIRREPADRVGLWFERICQHHQAMNLPADELFAHIMGAPPPSKS